MLDSHYKRGCSGKKYWSAQSNATLEKRELFAVIKTFFVLRLIRRASSCLICLWMFASTYLDIKIARLREIFLCIWFYEFVSNKKCNCYITLLYYNSHAFFLHTRDMTKNIFSIFGWFFLSLENVIHIHYLRNISCKSSDSFFEKLLETRQDDTRSVRFSSRFLPYNSRKNGSRYFRRDETKNGKLSSLLVLRQH